MLTETLEIRTQCMTSKSDVDAQCSRFSSPFP